MRSYLLTTSHSIGNKNSNRRDKVLLILISALLGEPQRDKVGHMELGKRSIKVPCIRVQETLALTACLTSADPETNRCLSQLSIWKSEKRDLSLHLFTKIDSK